MKRFLVFVSLLCISCEARVETDVSPWKAREHEAVLAIVVDMSGSFVDQVDSGRVYDLMMKASEKFFRRMGSDDRIIITQLSGERRTLLWEGPPGAIGKRFRSAKGIDEFLRKYSNPTASLVFTSMGDTMEYIMDMPGVTKDTKILMLVISDMLSTGEGDRDKQRALDSLDKFADRKSAIGLYYVSASVIPEWKGILKKSGIPHIIESEIKEDPMIPEVE